MGNLILLILNRQKNPPPRLRAADFFVRSIGSGKRLLCAKGIENLKHL